MSHLSLRWKRHPALCNAPPDLRSWLTAPDSLTARIVSRCKCFRVHIVSEGFHRPNPDEIQWLCLASRRHAWVRDVLLLADDTPVVFAHSVVAPSSLHGPWRLARAIGRRPLGAALFADPMIARGDIAIARLDQRHPLLRHATNAAGIGFSALWARRSRFLRLGHPLGVSEVFLPGIAELHPLRDESNGP